MVQATDAGNLDTDDPGTGAGVRGSGKQVRVVRGNDAAYDQGADTIEDSQATQETAGGLGNVASRGDSLTGSKTDELGRGDEAESGADEGCPVRGKPAGGARCQILLESSGVVPIVESQPLMVRSASQHDDETNNDEPHDGDELDTGEPELGLAKDLDGNNIQDQVDNKDDGDPSPCGNWRFPVVEEDSAGGRFGSDKNGVCVPNTVRVS